MRAAAALLLVVGFARPVPAEDPRTLASRLAHPNFHERETATKQLIAAGAPALPALDELRRSGSPEAVRRATTIVAAIRSADDSRQVVTVKSVTLNFQSKPLAAAVAELRQRTGVNLALDPKAVADPTRTVTLKTDDLSPWKAVEAFRSAAGLCEVFQTDAPLAPSVTQHAFSDSRYTFRTLSTTRPADVAVVWRDGSEACRPSDCSTGVRVQVVGNASHDRVNGEVTILLDVTPTAGLNWQRTDEVRIGRAESATGRRLEPLLRQEPPAAPIVAHQQLMIDSLDSAMPLAPPRLGNCRTFPVTLSADRAVTKLKVLEGIVCGEVHRANQPLLEIDDLPAAVGKTFDGPLGSTLTVVSLGRIAVDSPVLEVALRCTALSPWVLRQQGAAREGEIGDAAFNQAVGHRIKLYDAGGKELHRDVLLARADGDGTRETSTVKLTLNRVDSGPPKPVRLVVLGTKVVPVRVPFKLEHVELK